MKSRIVHPAPRPRQLPGVSTPLTYRRVQAGDGPALAAFYESLSARSRVLRFHGMGHLSAGQLADFATADGQRSAGFVALANQMIIGHCVLVPTDKAGTMEIAVAVADDFQHHRVGSTLCQLAKTWACSAGVRRLVAPVLWGNIPMEHLARHLGRTNCSDGAGVETFIATLARAQPGPGVAPRLP